MAAILTNGVLKHGAHLSAAVGTGALQGLWEHKGSRCTPANAAHSPPRRSPAPARARHAARKLTLSQLINRLLPQRTPVRHRRSNRRRLVRPNNQITRALAPPGLPRPPSPTPHDLTPKLRRHNDRVFLCAFDLIGRVHRAVSPPKPTRSPAR